MRIKIINSLFLIAFLAMITLPLIRIDPNTGRTSMTENRMLTDPPVMSVLFSQPAKFVQQFEEWFSDSIGFREQLIGLQKKIEGLNNPVQYTDGSYIYLNGEQGHRYFAYTDGWMIGKFQGKELLSKEQLSTLADALNDVHQYLDKRGIPMIMLISLDKDSVYPEYYPKSIIRGAEPIQVDIITKYLQDYTDIDVYNIRERLTEEKEDYPSFNRAHGDLTHYNDIGAFLEYLELMEHLNFHFSEMVPYTFDDVTIIYDEKEIPILSLKQDAPYVQLDASFFDNIEVERPFSWEQMAFENEDKTLPTILFMRDSYTNGFIKYIAPHFGKTIAIHYSNMENFKEYVDLYKPDIIVFEAAERQLKGFASRMINFYKKQF